MCFGNQAFFAKSVEVVLHRLQYWDGIRRIQAKKACFGKIYLCPKHTSIFWTNVCITIHYTSEYVVQLLRVRNSRTFGPIY